MSFAFLTPSKIGQAFNWPPKPIQSTPTSTRIIITMSSSSLFTASTQDEGTVKALVQIPDLTAKIQAGQGMPAVQTKVSTALLIQLLLDDSGSMQRRDPKNPSGKSNIELLCDGHNLIRSTLLGSKQGADVFMAARTLNGVSVYPFRKLKEVPELVYRQNFNIGGGTPLYDEIAVTYEIVNKQVEDYEEACIPCRTITVFITDGRDEHSKAFTEAKELLPLTVARMNHEMDVIVGVGISDGYYDFRKMFLEMGLLDNWILTPNNTEHEFREAFRVLSQSALNVSQAGAGGFSQAAAAGLSQAAGGFV